jgi:hypothetical protein
MKEISRRGFLKGGVAAATGLIIVPSLILPEAQAEPSRGDAWEYANELAKRAMPLVKANFQQFRGVPFNYEGFFIIYRKKESGDSISINTGGHQSRIHESNGEALTAILGLDGQQVTILTKGRIETKYFLPSPSRYMAYTMDAAYAQTTDGRGELENLRYVIAPRYGWQAAAEYHNWAGDQMVQTSGDPLLSENLPETFADIEIMTGRNVPKEINFKTTAWRLVNQSNLQGFTEALEQKFG